MSVSRLLLASALALASVGAPAAVFINEIHYDNLGADAGEAIEVVATSGENLADYDIVLYNGNGGASYDTDAVPTGSALACGGSATGGVINYPVDGLQNGAPDGIALVLRSNSSVIQFLSYEGTMTATNGPANGMLSTDIGVAEAASAPVGTSLQLNGGPGSTYASFTWTASATATFGACNTSQTFGVPPDVAPTVSSTVPANLATNVNPTANITVNFSEPVTTNAGWFAMSCTVSGPVSVVESGSGATRTLDPATNLVFGEQCSATILAASVIDQDGTLDPMAANYVFGFTVQADLVPTVVSTTPANLATNVAAVSNIDVLFSEAVTTNGAWFALSCTVSGAVTTVESGSGANRSLDPVPALAPGEQCTGTITAANVLDVDGTPNPMASNYPFSFTVQPDNLPTVVSTTPANAATNVAVGSNITINFSEAVSVSGSWYAISCAVSGTHTAVVSGGGASYTLNPDVDFDFLESCTVTLTAALIVDQDGTPNALASNYMWSFTSAASGSNYYASVNASSAATLRSTLHELIDDHIAYPYSGAGPCNPAAPTITTCDTWDILERADQNPGNPAEIIDVYQNDNHPKAGGGNADYNREHTWPNSLGFNNLSGLDGNGKPYSPYVDTHMLYLSDITYNSNRGNSPYDNCVGCTSQDPTVANNGIGGVGGAPFPGDSNWWDANNYRTWSARKGDVARAVLYMDVRYEGGFHANGQPEPDLIVTNIRSQIQGTPSGVVAAQGYMGILDTLIEWHQADPPDAQEVLRNEVVFGFQGNRNPFIDHPEWVACLWQNTCAPATVPGAPTSVVATAGNTEVSVAFAAPASNGGSTITGYTATCGGQSMSGSGSPIVVTGLSNGVAVTCTVIASNSVGPSLPSIPSNSVTPAATVPNAPTGVVATAGDSSVVVTFTAPLNNGGSAILSYTATCGAQSGGGTSPITVGGLTNGVAVSCTVFATNAIGPGAPSAASNTVTPAGAPGAPTAVVATAGNGQVSVAFTAPASNNGSAIISYTAECGGPVFTGPNSPILVTGLSNGVAVSCTVFATNGVSNGPASAPSNTVTPATVPNAPTSVVAVAGGSQVTVSFVAPGNNGGSAITGYTATCGTQSANGPGSPIVVSGLSNGVAVTCTVVATNGIGGSAPSTPSNSVTPTDAVFANGFE
ncbi:MAG: Ig-like domain-containing protein [Rhodanobacteraceae bacterium]|nr:Ig-like domain-containing protein [Rhodanobacteraceae bacterium]